MACEYVRRVKHIRVIHTHTYIYIEATMVCSFLETLSSMSTKYIYKFLVRAPAPLLSQGENVYVDVRNSDTTAVSVIVLTSINLY